MNPEFSDLTHQSRFSLFSNDNFLKYMLIFTHNKMALLDLFFLFALKLA